MNGARHPRTGGEWRDTRVSGLRKSVRDEAGTVLVDGLESGAPTSEAERHYRFLFEHMNEGLACCRVLCDGDRVTDFVCLSVNGAFERMTGIRDIVGKRLTEALPAFRESDPELFEICGRVARTGESERFEIYVEAAGQWFQVSAYSPEEGLFIAIFDMVTERKRTETKMRAIYDHLPGASFVWQRLGDEFVLTDLNDAAQSMVANDVADCIGRTPSGLLGGLPHLSEDLARVCTERTPVRREVACEIAVGQSPRHLVLTYGFIPNDTVVLYTEDITRQHQIEEQLTLAQRLEAVGRLAGGVAHDFNNLLSVILGSADFALAEVHEGQPQYDDLVAIREAGQRAAVLTRQLLAFSRKQLLQPEVVNLNHILYGMESLLRRLIGEDVELSVVLADELGKVKVDPGQIEQVIMNLALNSRDAMPMGGRLTLETSNVEIDEAYATEHISAKPGSYVLLSVSDSGLGMDEHTKEHLFEPFFTTKATGKGTGLGLSTVYGIVKQSGGMIWVYSEPGLGTTFRIYLPEETARAQAIRPTQRPSHGPRGAATILVVEDESAVRSLAVRILSSAGYKVLTAADGREALAVCERHSGQVHLLFTDVVMPGMSGRELVERLLPVHPELAVIYTSGYTDNAIVHHGVLDPGTNFVSKPFNATGLLRKVQEVLGNAVQKTGG